jgi:hypothetical protein
MHVHDTRGPLTPKRARLREWWLEYQARFGYWPSTVDAAEAFLTNASNIHRMLTLLQRDGWAYRIGALGQPRSWAMRPDPDEG